MPLLDHFHPPLHGPRRWEGFHHSWAAFIAQQLNQECLPAGYFAESEISLGPELEIDVAAREHDEVSGCAIQTATATWSPPRPKTSVPVDYSRLDSYEIRVYQDLGGAVLRAAVELVSPSNKDRPGSRRTFAAKCAGYLKHGIGLVILDVVTLRSANLHADLYETLEVKGQSLPFESETGLYAVAYRPVTELRKPRLEIWPHKLTLGRPLPELPLWLARDVAVPLRLEQSYVTTCQSLRISA
jgi:hypothetical protein